MMIFFNRKHLIMMKNDQNNNFLLKTGDILNFRFFEETTILQELEPEKVRYLGISLTDFASKTWFGIVDKFYIGI